MTAEMSEKFNIKKKTGKNQNFKIQGIKNDFF